MNSRNFKILYVEDDRDLAEMFIELIQDEFDNVEIDLADDGLVGIDLLESSSYQMIITDYKMPRMNGIQFLEESHLRMGSERPPVIFASALCEELEERNLSDAVFDQVAFLTKPFDADVLFEKIRQIMVGKIDEATSRSA